MKTQHALIKLETTNTTNLSNERSFEETMSKISELLGTKILGFKFHKFEPYGLTGVALLNESHIAVHTWPEFKTIVIDILSCKDFPFNLEDGLKVTLNSYFSIDKFSIKIEED